MSTDPARVVRFDAVAAATYEPLQRYLRRRASADDAADVLGDTLLAIWRRLDDVPADDPLPWCYGVARRCLSNHHRGGHRRRRLQARLEAAPTAPGDGDPQAAVERSDPELASAIARLSAAERELVRLWAWERLEPREIAVVLGSTPNAVSVALARAKRKLAARLTPPTDRQDPPPPGQETDGRTIEHGREP